jgi:precorrin-6B methylase 1
MDEINETISHLMEPSRVLAKAKTIAGFKRVIAAGGHIVNVSADISHSVIEVMKILSGTSNAHLSIYASVQDTPQAKLEINVSNILADGFMTIERALQAKEKLYIATDHKKMSEEVAAFCEAYGATTKVINSKTKDSSLLRPNDIDNKYEVIIGTPSISSGVSLVRKNVL